MANMNAVHLQGRATKDIDLRYSGDLAVARFTLAVDRVPKKDGTKQADFISCVAYGKTAEFVNKYFGKGNTILLNGSIKTGSYDGKNGKVYTTDVIAEQVFFCSDGKKEKEESTPTSDDLMAVNEGFMSIPDSADSDGLPFN